MYLSIGDIKEINCEHTSRCNLLCPQCSRVLDNKLNPNLSMDGLLLSDYKRIFSHDLLSQLKHMFFCGNYGDAVAQPEFLDVIKFLSNYNMGLTIYTNGSLKSKLWWSELGILLNSRSKVIFSIDGLETTSSLYRVNSNFNKVIENATSFIKSGGTARWDYLVFDYNMHQVDEAKKLASDIGFKIFNEKNSMRKITNKDYKANLKESKGSTGKFGDVIEKYGSWENYINKTTIECTYKKRGIIYIDFEQNVWPCCWVGAPTYFDGKNNIQKNQLKKLIERYGKGFNSLKTKSLEEVLKHPWFNNDLEDSWNNTMSDDNFKLMTCGRTCGTDYKFSSGDSSNRKVSAL